MRVQTVTLHTLTNRHIREPSGGAVPITSWRVGRTHGDSPLIASYAANLGKSYQQHHM